MGRKSSNSKVKEKKLKRKEESARIGAKQAIIDAANAQEDPMVSLAPFKRFDRNGLALTIGCHRAPDLDDNTNKWIFDLTKTNMQALYEASDWGWNDKQKKEEMTDESAWYLIARDEEQQPVALVHFRFDLDFEEEVLYCYEIQLTKSVRRKGLGKFLVQILELLAHKNKMSKVMCTVFNNNEESRAFFMDKLKYELDDTSPSESMEEALYDEEGYTYKILKKSIGQKAKAVSKTNGSVSNGHVAAKS